MKLRQIALAATHLEPIRSNLLTLLGLTSDFADPGVAEFGLHNTVQTIGNTYLEVVAPNRPDTAAGRTLTSRGESLCGYMVLFQVKDFAAFDARLTQQKLRKVWQINRPEVSAAHVHPKDIGGAIVSFDEMRPANEWIWAGSGWRERRAQHATSIVGCEVGAIDPEALCRRWAEVLNVTPRQTTLHLDDETYVSFTEANRDGVQKAIIATPTPDNMNQRAAALGLGAVLRFVSET